MYDRKYGDEVLAFEPSGGLLNASLVMRDRETDSWWSIITGEAIGGTRSGTKLKEVPVSKKMQWKDWKALHPDTLVLSVRGREHHSRNPYDRYFRSREGFHGLTASDRRLADKESIYAFLDGGDAYAVSHRKTHGGTLVNLNEKEQVFLYRNSNWSSFASTMTYRVPSDRITKKDGQWIDSKTGIAFSEKSGFGSTDDGIRPLEGFDTYWYIWSTIHRNTRLLF